MGLRFRKSFNLGNGFRINLSKSGIGYSWGTKGFRYSISPNGKSRKTYSIPGTGISFIKSNKQKNKPINIKTLNNDDLYDGQEYKNSEELYRYTNDEFQEFLKKSERFLKYDFLANILIFSFYLSILGILIKIYLRLFYTSDIIYEIDEYYQEEINKSYASWENLFKCKKMWKVNSSFKTNSYKKHSGATNILDKSEIKLKHSVPYIKCDEPILTFKSKGERIIILPDRLLFVKRRKINAIPIHELNFTISSSNFIERGPVPKDAQIIDYTWQYVNKNGSPDKRNKTNRRIPICNYGEIHIISNDELVHIALQCSNYNLAADFVDSINKTNKIFNI